MKCPNCKCKITKNQNFCKNCGTKIEHINYILLLRNFIQKNIKIIKRIILSIVILYLIAILSFNIFNKINEDKKNRFVNPYYKSITPIGVVINKKNNQYVIKEVIKNSPAEKNNLKQNDVILRVDNKPVDNLSLYEVYLLIRGKYGSKVKLSVLRDGKEITLNIPRKGMLSKYLHVDYNDDFGTDIYLNTSYLKWDNNNYEVCTNEYCLNLDLNNKDYFLYDVVKRIDDNSTQKEKKSFNGNFKQTVLKPEKEVFPEYPLLTPIEWNWANGDYIEKNTWKNKTEISKNFIKVLTEEETALDKYLDSNALQQDKDKAFLKHMNNVQTVASDLGQVVDWIAYEEIPRLGYDHIEKGSAYGINYEFHEKLIYDEGEYYYSYVGYKNNPILIDYPMISMECLYNGGSELHMLGKRLDKYYLNKYKGKISDDAINIINQGVDLSLLDYSKSTFVDIIKSFITK